MRVDVEAASLEQVDADVLAAPAREGPLAGAAAALDLRLNGLLGRLADEGEVRRDANAVSVVHVDGDLAAHRVAVAGVGRADALDADALRTAAGAVARATREYAGAVAWLIDDSLPLAPAEQARAIVDGTLLGSYDPGRWKHANCRPRRLERLVLVSDEAGPPAADRAGIVAGWANRARDLANTPPNVLTPEGLAEQAVVIAERSPHLSAEVLGFDEIRRLGMGAFAGVAQGSHNPA